MDESEGIHQVTDQTYKNLVENFTPALKQFLNSGKAYHRALQAVSHCHKAYVESLAKLCPPAQHDGYSIGADVSGALHQITDLFKEVHSLNNEYMQAFSAELLSPLEDQQDNEYKNTVNDQKKYHAGSKYHAQTIEKARGSLSKVQKRGKTKGKMQPKEMELLKSVSDRQTLLTDYRIESCKKVLMEERRRYCLLLERLCHVISSQSNTTRRAHELLHSHLPRWVELSRKPNTLPDKTDALIKAVEERIDDGEYSDKSVSRLTPEGSQGMNGQIRGDGHVPNGIPPSRYTELASVGPSMPSPMKAPLTGKATGATLPRTITVPSPVSAQGRPQVRAIYTHIGKGDHTLSFTETDIITLIGEAKEGWQYGENTRSNRFGWFPISFTEPLDSQRSSPGLENNKGLSKSADQLNNGYDNPIYDSRPDPSQYQSSPAVRRSHSQVVRAQDFGPMSSPFADRRQVNPLYQGPPQPPFTAQARPISMYNLVGHMGYDGQGRLDIPEMIQEERKSMPDIRPMQGRVPPAPPPPPPPPGTTSRFQPVHQPPSHQQQSHQAPSRTSPPNLGQDPYGNHHKPHAQHPPQFDPSGRFPGHPPPGPPGPPQAPPQAPPRPPNQNNGYQYQDYDPYGYLSGAPPSQYQQGGGYQGNHGGNHGNHGGHQGNHGGNHGNHGGRGGEPGYMNRRQMQQQNPYQNGHVPVPPVDYDTDDGTDQLDNQFARQKQLLRKAATNDRSGPHIRR